MTIDGNAFRTALRNFFTSGESLPTTFGEAGTKWATLYAVYAADAQAGPADARAATVDTQTTTKPTPASIDRVKTTLGGALAETFGSVTNAGDLAAGMAAAFSAFWPAVTFEARSEAGEVFATGKATSPAVQELRRQLSDFFSDFDPTANPPATAEHQADRMASLLDAWTQTVTVVNTINGQIQPAIELR